MAAWSACMAAAIRPCRRRFAYGGSSGNFNYFVSGDYTTNTLGIESPDGSSDPLHDRTKQYHGFVFLQDILDQNSSVTARAGHLQRHLPDSQPGGTSARRHRRHCRPGAAQIRTAAIIVLNANGADRVPVGTIWTNASARSPITASSAICIRPGALDFQVSTFGRYSSLFFTPGANVGDILYNGIAQTAYKRDVAYGLQAEGAWHLGDAHTVRFGVLYQADDMLSNTSSLVLPTADGGPRQSQSQSALPRSGPDLPDLGHAADHRRQWLQAWLELRPLCPGRMEDRSPTSPSITACATMPSAPSIPKTSSARASMRCGRRPTPPPSMPAMRAISRRRPSNWWRARTWRCSTTPPAATDHTDTTPKAERADYFDAGLVQKLRDGLEVGLDSFYKMSHNLIDEGQFGAPIILTPFNYAKGRQYGAEFTAQLSERQFHRLC